MNADHRHGLTRVEVILLIALGVLGLGVLLVFLQNAREGSRRTQCANNLKLIGEAIHYFEGTPENLKEARLAVEGRGVGHKFLPAARIAEGHATWAVQIAPYLSNNPLAKWDLQAPYHAQPQDVRQASITEFLCPARTRVNLLSVAGDTDAAGGLLAGALGDYACAAGNGDPRRPWTGHDANGAIILGEADTKGDLILRWRSRTSFASLKRGLAYTILVGEKHVPVDKMGEAAFGDGSLYNGQHPASFSRIGGPGYELASSPTAPFNANFGSYHSGLCQFLMGDTSIRPLANHVSGEILGKLIVRE